MVTKIWIFQVISALISGVLATELLPERYIKPQDFNYHPFTDVGIPAALKKVLKSTNPYAVLLKKRPREGREFPPQNVVIYPTPHPSVISRKYVETNEVGKNDDPYANIPKNYAFSYFVKDQHSGDDFSHSQAHNGKATRGQYRVKLPDGRTQIVSYTADHKGYRADVQYEEDIISKPLAKPFYHPVQAVPEKSIEHPRYSVGFVPNRISPVKITPSAQAVYTVTASPSNYHPSSTNAGSLQFVTASTPLNLVVKSTTAPLYYQPHYVTSTAAPYVQQQYVTPTASHFLPQHHVSSTPLNPVDHAVVNAGLNREQFPNYQAVSSTASPDHAVIVTPRPAYNRAIKTNEQQQSAPLYYKLL